MKNHIDDRNISHTELFSSFDTNKDGQIDHFELLNGFKSMGIDGLSPMDINELVQLMDVNGDGKINGTDVSNVLDISLNSNNSDGNGVLRDSTKADPFVDNTITITPGNDMTFHAYIIGDANGSYADVLSAG